MCAGGTLTDLGAVWQVTGGGKTTTVTHDTANKCLRVTTPTGTILLLR
jgi:hypothetical protein